jgi:hypothetical protein
VRCEDLRIALHVIDRLDSDLRQGVQAGELPPLPPRFAIWKDPDEDCGAWGQPDRDVFTADQMREYARAALAASQSPLSDGSGHA